MHVGVAGDVGFHHAKADRIEACSQVRERAMHQRRVGRVVPMFAGPPGQGALEPGHDAPLFPGQGSGRGGEVKNTGNGHRRSGGSGGGAGLLPKACSHRWRTVPAASATTKMRKRDGFMSRTHGQSVLGARAPGRVFCGAVEAMQTQRGALAVVGIAAGQAVALGAQRARNIRPLQRRRRLCR
ncbi:hypothetical protein XcmpCFBP7700_17770 [Xanthomonas campestris]|nr:hypothetical protein XcmpCFBP7700_17770 [Xanthomonas campestris]